MPIAIVVPEVGEVGMDLLFVDWLRREGDRVEAGDPLFELDTDKTTVEVQAFASGTLAGQLIAAGERVAPRQVVGYLLQEGESIDVLAATDASTVEEPVLSEPAVAEGEPDSTPAERRHRVAATPRARAFAREHEIDLELVDAAHPGRTITMQEVEEWMASKAPGGGSGSERSRQAVARRTAAAWKEIPHFHLRLQADVTDALVHCRPTTAVCAAAARALALHPECNLEWHGEDVRRRAAVDLGLLVASDAGLLLPTLPRADTLPLSVLESRLRELTERARAGRLRPDDLATRSLTISNLGMFAVDGFDAVISAPDVLLLSVGRTRTQPRWFGDGWSARQVIDLTLAVDHRALDGVEAARFLGTLEELLAAPSRLT